MKNQLPQLQGLGSTIYLKSQEAAIAKSKTSNLDQSIVFVRCAQLSCITPECTPVYII